MNTQIIFTILGLTWIFISGTATISANEKDSQEQLKFQTIQELSASSVWRYDLDTKKLQHCFKLNEIVAKCSPTPPGYVVFKIKQNGSGI